MTKTLLVQLKDKTTLTFWMNHLLVVYAFLIPISTYAASFIFSLILILFLIRRNFEEFLSDVFQNKLVQAFILFFFMHIIWLLGTENFTQAKQSINIVKYSLFPIIFLSFLDKNFAKYIIISFTASMLFSELFSYALQLHIIPWEFAIASIPIYKSYEIGDPSPFLHHSHYAVSLAFVSVILLYQLIKMKATKVQKLITLFFIFSISVNLSLVGGRAGYVLYVILILFLILYIYKKKFLPIIIMFILLLATLSTIAYQLSPMFEAKIKQTTQTLQSFKKGEMDFTTSLGSRFGFWYYSSDVIKENFLLGVGTGDYMDEVQKTIPHNTNNIILKTLEHPHNLYVQLLLQFGVLGLALFFYLIYRVIKQKTQDEYMQFIKLAITITILVALLSETFAARYYLVIFVILISSTIASRVLIKKETTFFTKRIFIMYFILIILAMLNAKLHYIIALVKTLI